MHDYCWSAVVRQQTVAKKLIFSFYLFLLFAIVFTKADKLKGGRLNTHINEYLEQLKEQWEELPPYFITSSENRMGRKELLDYL